MTGPGDLFHDPDLLASARGIAAEFAKVGREERTQEVLRALADRYEVMVGVIASENDRANALGQIVLACIAAGHVTATVTE